MFDLDPYPKLWIQTFLQKFKQVKQWFTNSASRTFYPFSMENAKFCFKNSFQNTQKATKFCLDPTFKEIQISYKNFLAIVWLLNVHICAKIQCVAGSLSKIQINPSASSHALKTCCFRQAPSRIQPGTRKLPPPQIRIQCFSGSSDSSLPQLLPPLLPPKGQCQLCNMTYLTR